jgi:Domain of unknown function (DUF4328)
MTYPQSMESYVSARGRAIALNVLVILQLVFLGLATVAWGIGASELRDNPMIAVGTFGTAGALETIDLLLYTSATIVFLTWVYRSIANLPALGSMSCRFSPAGAVWSWFIPFVNLVRGHQVMATIWQESQPPAVNENGFYLPRKTTLVSWWWGLYLFGAVVSLSCTNMHPVGLEEVHSLASTQVWLHFVRMTTALLFLLMVRGSQKRQDEQWQDLERRRNVPKPTAEALR